MADPFRLVERLMAMDDEAWARHANPWSGVTRFSVLPLLVLAVWSRVWIGWWCRMLIAGVVAWIELDARVFTASRTCGHWASRVVPGERILPAHRTDVPAHYLRVARLLAWATPPGIAVPVRGLWTLWWEGAVFGTVLAMGAKAWFRDRMVWIHDDRVRAGRAVPGGA